MSTARPLPPRDTHGPTPLAQCGPVSDLVARAHQVDQLSQRIVPSLPSPLRAHVSYAGLRHDQVLLLVESPAWATRVRTDQARILASVHSVGLAASSVAAKVVPRAVALTAATRPLPAPPHTARGIRAAAAAIADPDLRDLFLALADDAADAQTR